MRKLVLIYILVVTGLHTQPQTASVWKSFYDTKKDLHGFKNEKGEVVIPPKFSAFIIAHRFEHIMVAAEDNENHSSIYYLTKSGKEVAQDSVWMVDNTPDCEHEGFIRFKNKATGGIGMLNRHGKVVIPAVYNDLSPAQNGFVIALKDATKNHMGHKHDLGDEHFIWEGGTTVLLDTSNKVLIENFDKKPDLNFYDFKLSDQPSSDTMISSFKATNGKYYLFSDYEKEFKSWLNQFLKNPSKENLISITYPQILAGHTSEKSIASKSYLNKNYALILTSLQETQKKDADYYIDHFEFFSPKFIEKTEPGKYFTHCGELDRLKYPLFNVIITNTSPSGDSQKTFSFIKTDKGYKLISIDMPSGNK